MAIELSTVTAGLPMAASFAMAGGFVALREGRRRSALNAAMHELRRPLQALSLSLPPGAASSGPFESSLALAVAAIDRLDREVNGREVEAATERLSLGPLIEEAVERWQPIVRRAGRSLRLAWSGGDAVLRGDRVALSQLLDNLISNSFEHGSGAIVVDVRVEGCLFGLAVRDAGRGAVGTARRGRLLGQRLGGRNRHGHGLAIVRRAVARHGGSFRLRHSNEGSEARVALPLCGEAR